PHPHSQNHPLGQRDRRGNLTDLFIHPSLLPRGQTRAESTRAGPALESHMELSKVIKPMGRKAYGSICHLPGSRLGPGDHKLNEDQTRILTERCRDKHDLIVVQEKLDGSNVAVARINGEVIALGRAGYPAAS